jgi:bifunctional non-homologous end joining protein LigD
MLSWAVPKGPSLEPTVRRLAMQTEAHPMEYNDFEGVIPEGEYGGGTVMIWDRGVWVPEVDDVEQALARGRLKFRLEGKKLRGSWALVRTGGPRQWLLIKHRDQHASTEDLTVTRPRSVVSRRTMVGIARAAAASPRQLAQAAAAVPPSARPGREPAVPAPAVAGPRATGAGRGPAGAASGGRPRARARRAG